MTALILGVAAAAWFSWGNARPPASLSVALAIGSALGLGVAAAGGWQVRRLRSGPSAMDASAVRSRWRRVVGVELAAIAVGVVVLAGTGEQAYVPAWILLVVGGHFIPLDRLFGIGRLDWAGVALIVVAAGAAATGAATGILPSTVAGVGGGLVCLAAAAACLRRLRTRAPRPGSFPGGEG
jgi:hypothetical protein